jgi:hypothetical protein
MSGIHVAQEYVDDEDKDFEKEDLDDIENINLLLKIQQPAKI